MTTRKTVTIDGETHELSDEFLAQILETAVEGACAHWADVDADHAAGDESSGDFDASDYAEEDDNDEDASSYTSASFLVSEDPSQGGTLDLVGIADAMERIASGEVEIDPTIRENIIAAIQDDDASEIDAEAADCIIQVGLFDEVVYR